MQNVVGRPLLPWQVATKFGLGAEIQSVAYYQLVYFCVLLCSYFMYISCLFVCAAVWRNKGLYKPNQISYREKLHLITTFNFTVDVSATAVAFFGMVLITSVRRRRLLLYEVFTAQCTLVQMRGLGIACRPSVRPSVCNVGDL